MSDEVRADCPRSKRRRTCGAAAVIVKPRAFPLVRAVETYWPASPDDARAALRAAPVAVVMQCTDAVAQALAPLAFWRRPFYTVLIDLTWSEPDLWRDIRPRTRRYINAADRAGYDILVNRETAAARRLIDAFIARSRYRRPVSAAEWRRVLSHSDVFVLRHNGEPVVARVVLADGPVRARGMFSATADRSADGSHTLIGALNKALFWFEIRHYKARGFRWYDMAGIESDPASPHYEVNNIKQAFGGAVVREHILYLARTPGLRAGLRGVAALRRRGWAPGAPMPETAP